MLKLTTRIIKTSRQKIWRQEIRKQLWTIQWKRITLNRQVTNKINQMLGKENRQKKKTQKTKGFEGWMAWKAHRDSDGKRERGRSRFRWKVQIPMRSELSQKVRNQLKRWASWSDGGFQRRASGQVLSQNGQMVAFRRLSWTIQMVRWFKNQIGQRWWVGKPLCELEKPESRRSLKTIWKLICNT